MNAEETQVLKQIIGSIKDYNEGGISQTTLAFDMQDYLPQLLELENYIVALETDLETEREMVWEGDELMTNYIMISLDDDLEGYEEDYDEED